jgi:hypothetical protein
MDTAEEKSAKGIVQKNMAHIHSYSYKQCSGTSIFPIAL